MRKIIFGLFALGIILACNSDDNGVVLNDQNFLIFGHFFGECGGEKCIETYKLTSNALFEDTLDDFSLENRDFVALNDTLFEQVQDLPTFFPIPLLNQSETIIGCPDCADGGGLFVLLSRNGNERSWRIDLAKENVPDYLHGFIDKINEKIALINADCLD